MSDVGLARRPTWINLRSGPLAAVTCLGLAEVVVLLAVRRVLAEAAVEPVGTPVAAEEVATTAAAQRDTRVARAPTDEPVGPRARDHLDASSRNLDHVRTRAGPHED